jgi:hypothetical protein
MALALFEREELNLAMGVPFFYGVVEAFFVGIYCVVAWKAGWTKAPANVPIWTAILTSYEVVEYCKQDIDGIEIEHSESSDPLDERTDGNILTHYFNLNWYQPSPAAEEVPSQQEMALQPKNESEIA